MSTTSTDRADAERAHDEGALVVRPRRAFKMIHCGPAKGYELINSGELPSYKEGRARKIPVWGIHEYIRRKLATDAARRRGQLPRGNSVKIEKASATGSSA